MKRKLFALFITCLSISLVTVNVKGESGTIELPYRYYYYYELEAGNNDLVSWSFESTGNQIELYLLDSESFQLYHALSLKVFLQIHGEKLSGYVHDASGSFRPEYEDTWYFIFLNSGVNNNTARVEYSISNFKNYYIIIPALITLVIILVVIIMIVGVYSLTKKQQQQAPVRIPVTEVLHPTPVKEEQQEKQQQAPPKIKFIREYCPRCGVKVKDPTKRYCENCMYDFHNEE